MTSMSSGTSGNQLNMQDFQERIQDIQKRLTEELRDLDARNILSQTDIRKIMNQARATRDALIESINNQIFQSDIKNELISSLIRDYEASIQKIIDDAIARQGPMAAINYQLDRVDTEEREHIVELRNQGKISREYEFQVYGFMAGARDYLLKSISKRSSFFRRPRVNVKEIVKEYRQTIEGVIAEHTRYTLQG